MIRRTRKLSITPVLFLIASVGVAQADNGDTLIALRMPSHETRVQTNLLTHHREFTARGTAELATGFGGEGRIDIFSRRAIERVALHQPATDTVPAGDGNPIAIDCESIRGKRPAQLRQTERAWQDLGLLGANGCRELSQRAPVREITSGEKLARKHPPKEFDLWGLKIRYERYPVGAVEPSRYAAHFSFLGRREPVKASRAVTRDLMDDVESERIGMAVRVDGRTTLQEARRTARQTTNYSVLARSEVH